MNNTNPLRKSTSNSINITKDCVREDKHTYRWFVKLILQKAIKAELIKNADF